MNEMTFLKGADVTVAADGVTLGGVTAVECGEDNKVEVFGEFLTDVPAAQFPKTAYYIKITMKAQPYGSLGLNPGTVELVYGGRRVTYSDCCVEKVKCEVLPASAVRYTVTLRAGGRSVANV